MAKLADRFILEREIGSGGMARVFLGRDEVLDRPVAVKVLNTVHGGTDIGERFQREGRTAARLAHPNIVQVYDAGEGELDGRESAYIVMEYIPGGDLKALIDRLGRLPGEDLSRLGAEVCSGLAHAHERGVIHRDIKPHNILLDENGHAKVTDFGIARALDSTSQATLTGAYLGTALYSSPEQLQGQKVTPKSDVYSLGTTLYQAAAGEPPFSGGTPIEIASQHVSKSPTSLRERGADVSEDLDNLILACLAKQADDRPTAEEARSRLEAAIPTASATREQTEAPAAPPPTGRTRPTPAAPPPGGRPAVRPVGRGRRGRRRGALAVLALVAVLAVIGALAAPGFFGGNGEQGSGQGGAGQGGAGQNNAQQGGAAGEAEGGGVSGSQDSGGDQQAAAGDASATASASAQPSSEEPAPSQGSFTAEAAEQTVEEFYTTTSEGEYERSAELLSESWEQSTFPNRATFEGTFAPVERVEFVEGPTAEISGDTATVTGETEATLTTEVQRNQGVWRLVQEGGGWKIDGWNVDQLSTRPA